MAVSCVMERQFTVRAAMRRTSACHNRRVPVLRMASLTVMALWIGGLAALVAVVEPALPGALAQHDVPSAPALASQVAGDLYTRFQQVSWVLGGCVLALLGVRAALGPRPRRLAVQLLLTTAMLAMTAWSLSTVTMAVTLGLGLALFWIESWD